MRKFMILAIASFLCLFTKSEALATGANFTASTPANGTFYLYNVGADMFLTSGANWGSHAALSPHPSFPLTLTLNNGAYTISTTAIYEGRFLGDNGYMDNGTAANWTFTSVGNDAYTIQNNGNYLQWNGIGYNTDLVASPSGNNAYWKLVTKENLEALLSNATTANPIDATFFMTNSWFARGDGNVSNNTGIVPKGWTGTTVTDYWGDHSGEETANYCIEQYHKQFDNYQVLSVPNGEYVLTAQGYYRAGVDNKNGVPVFYANDASSNLVNINDDGPTEKPNGIATAASALRFETSPRYYLVTGVTGQVVDGTLRVGVKCMSEDVDWCAFDNFSLVCTGLYFSADALPLPNDDTTPLVAGQWYYYIAPSDGTYTLNGNRSGLVFTTNGAQKPESVTAYDAPGKMNLTSGKRIYFKTSHGGSTLYLSPATNDEVTFTACALNVDGLPQSINLVVYNINLNGDGPGSDGTKAISSYLAGRSLDIIGVSEDFNYDGSLRSRIDSYNHGTWRGSIALAGDGHATLNGLQFDTDGLNLYTKGNYPLSKESWTKWNRSEGSITDGNDGQFDDIINKGFRYYQVELKDGFFVDVYVLHMDAGSRNGNSGTPRDGLDSEARNAQWTQLANYILTNNDNGRPKIVIGDTNSRYTRDKVKTNFIDVIDASGNYEAKDAWVELVRGGEYPTYGADALTTGSRNSATCEIVDKIIYINPTYGTKIQAQAFDIDETNYKYPDDYADESKRGQFLGDHFPVVVTFQTVGATNIVAEQSQWWVGETPTHSNGDINNGYYLYNVGYKFFISENSTPVVTDIHQAPRWPANGYCSTTSEETSFSRSNSWRILKTGIFVNPGVGSGSAREFQLKTGEPNQTLNSYKLWFHENSKDHRFGIAYNEGDDGSYYYNEATNTSDIYNDWFFITQAQKDAYDAYVCAYNNLKTLNDIPLPDAMYVQLQQLLEQASAGNANYTNCGKVGDGGYTDQMVNFYDEVIAHYSLFFEEGCTSEMVNPSFEDDRAETNNPTGWTVTADGADTGARDLNNATYAFTPSGGSYTFNSWGGTAAQGHYCYQEIPDLPAGYYVLTATVATDTQLAKWEGAEGVENIRNRQIVKLLLGDNKRELWIEQEKGVGMTYQTIIYHYGGSLKVGAESDTWFKVDNFQLTRFFDYYDVTIGDALYATLSLPWNATIPSGVTAYTSDYFNPSNHKIELQAVNSILPARTGVILYSDTPDTYRFYYNGSYAAPIDENILSGTVHTRLTQDRRDEVHNAYYVLANRDNHVAMYRLGKAAIPQYRAYLMLPISQASTTAGMIERVAFGFDNDPDVVVSEDGGFVDAITTPKGTNDEVIGIYAPNGTRLQGMQKGVNIILMSNGTSKKIIR